MVETARLSRIAAVLALAALAGACQSTGETDGSGKPVQMSGEQAIGPADTTANVAAFFDPGFIRGVKRVVRDNQFPYETLDVEDRGGKGVIQIGHSGGGTRWNGGETYWREAGFREKAAEIVTDLRDVREIRHRNALVGYRGVGRHVRSIATCVVAFTAYDLIGTTANFRGNVFDTGVSLIFCGQDPDPATFDAMLSELDLVRDRGAYRAAVQGRASAAPAERALPLAREDALIARNRLVVTWQGYASEFEGVAQSYDTGTGGELLVALPDGDGTCKGTFLYGPGRASGTWSAACTNSLAASGTFKGLGSGKGFAGAGIDSRGRPVTFTVSPPLEKPRPAGAI